ncbi:MAG: HTH domain-containing protein [Firmicutes bacterium]|nr:HTH domain-containing protein [Bacillota bacterium]
MALTADRRFRIIAILAEHKGYVSAEELCRRIEGVSRRTIRSDIDALCVTFAIESRTGPHGGYRLVATDPVPIQCASMLQAVKAHLDQTGGCDGYDAALMEHTIRLLYANAKHG